MRHDRGKHTAGNARGGKTDHSVSATRRSFLKGSSMAAASAAVAGTMADGAREALAQERAAAAVGPGAVPITFTLNGERVEASIEPRQTLVGLLRDQLELTGTKVVCNRGACSACSVTLNGAQVASCSVLAIDVDGGEVTTIEGQADGFSLTALQEAFVRNDAQMCGMCTPGFVQNAQALLDRNPNPSLEEVKTALSGNLCRCGTYPKIFAAVMDASGQSEPQDGTDVLVRA